jgi:hypothetical protein
MKLRLFALFLLPAAAMAQTDPEMPSNLFFDTDLVLFIPKWTMQYGVRGLTGASSTFRGTGYVDSMTQDAQLGIRGPGDFASKGIARGYHDGTVSIDTRTAVVDDGTGKTITVPVTSDGRTNTWSYQNAVQAQANGTVAMHTYTSAIADGGGRSKKSDTGYGMEVTFRHDTGKSFGKVSFDLLGGMGLNGINSRLTANEKSTITTLTDAFTLNGQDAPTAPYSAPSTSTATLVNANGQSFVGSDGSSQTGTRDTTVPLAQEPSVDRTTTTSTDSTSVSNRYHLKGAYFTFRAGPSMSVPIGDRFRATVSAGAALVYAGTTYTVQQDFTPATGDLITSTVERSEANILPGLYADANLEMTLTERAGAFVGIAYQNSGSFNQGINDGQVNYGTKVKLNNLSGVRMGLNVRF